VVQVDPAPQKHVVTQVPRLTRVEPMVREAVALLLEVPPDSFDIEVDIRLPGSVRELIDRTAELRHEAQLAAEAVTRAAADAARALLDLGLTMREAGQVLGLSHQRVLQLVHRNVPAQ
jgi:hypothetical protein